VKQLDYKFVSAYSVPTNYKLMSFLYLAHFIKADFYFKNDVLRTRTQFSSRQKHVFKIPFRD